MASASAGASAAPAAMGKRNKRTSARFMSSPSQILTSNISRRDAKTQRMTVFSVSLRLCEKLVFLLHHDNVRALFDVAGLIFGQGFELQRAGGSIQSDFPLGEVRRGRFRFLAVDQHLLHGAV